MSTAPSPQSGSRTTAVRKTTSIAVLIVDPHPVVRVGLKRLIDAQVDMAVVGEAADGPAAVRLATELDPDIIIVEVVLPGLGGAEVTARLQVERKVIALAGCEDANSLHHLVAAGAAGYVLKRSPTDSLLHAIRAVVAGGTYLDPEIAGLLVRDRPPTSADASEEVSEREAQVLRLIVLGYSNKEVAARLRLSVKTVETYKARALEKLGLRSRVELVRYGVANGWLLDPDQPGPTMAHADNPNTRRV